MKISILYEFKNTPYGGGNQFLKALRKELISQKKYVENPNKADIIIFNSSPTASTLLRLLKLKKSGKIIVHRVDGPYHLIRGTDIFLDKHLLKCNELLADGTIFQSQFSYKENARVSYNSEIPHTIIYNAPDKEIFKRTPKNKASKTRIVATSWSKNMRKGFDYYQYLDKNLDERKFEFVFIGNSPLKLKNIIPPLDSKSLAKELQKSHIFLTASQKDPCSNSLIEGLSVGLPAAVLNDGGHPELIKTGGEVFNNKKEMIKAIQKISDNYDYYVKKVPSFDIGKCAEQYYDFCTALTARKETKTIIILKQIISLKTFGIIKMAENKLKR